MSTLPVWRSEEDSLLERIGNESEHFLILVEQEHDAQVTQSFVGESVRPEITTQAAQFDSLTVNRTHRGDATSFKHSIWPKWAG